MTGKAQALTDLYRIYSGTAVLLPVSDGKKLVPGHGPLDAPLVVVGEAPGEQEERQCRPFVGPAGQELQRLFGLAGLPWDLCYVTNVLPWRPPGNRAPYPFEIAASMARVANEIAIIGPHVTVAAGAVAFQAVTAKKRGHASDHRGRWICGFSPEGHPGTACDLLTIFHPAALLRERREKMRREMEAETVAALASALAGERDC